MTCLKCNLEFGWHLIYHHPPQGPITLDEADFGDVRIVGVYCPPEEDRR